MSRSSDLRDDPGYWLCALLLLMPPVWPFLLVALIWNAPSIYRDYKRHKECEARGFHLWGEYQGHPYADIPQQYCTHCKASSFTRQPIQETASRE